MNRFQRFYLLCSCLLFIATVSRGQLVADFAASVPGGCAPFAVTFTADTTGNGPAAIYSWNLGNGYTPTGAVVSTTYLNPNNYIVTLTVTSGSATATKTDTMHGYAKPVISYSSSTTAGCAPLSVQFNATVGGSFSPGPVSYDWDFGDGSAHGAFGPTTSHIYQPGGPFNVLLTVTNYAGCQQYVSTINITSYAPPVGQITASPQVYSCSAPATFTFTNNSSGVPPFTNTTWVYGDATPNGAGNTVSHTYAATGAYSVSLTTMDANGCFSAPMQPLGVIVYPNNPSFTAPTAVCLNDQAAFVNTTINGSNTIWDFGDAVTDTGYSPSHAYTATGTYTVTMITYMGPCADTVRHSILVRPLPPPTLVTYSPAIPCPAPVYVTLTATTPGIPNAVYNWTFIGIPPLIPTTTGAGSPITHLYTANRYWTVVLGTTDPATGCKTTMTLEDTVKVRSLVPLIEADSSGGCAPFTSPFRLSLWTRTHPPPSPPDLVPYPVPAVSWNWTFNNGTSTPDTSTLSNLNYTWNNVGIYRVTVTGMSANGCPYTGTTANWGPPDVHVDVPVVPDFYAVPDTICTHTAVTFYNTTIDSPRMTYTWSTTDSVFSTYSHQGFTHVFNKPGFYTVFLLADHASCKALLTKYNYIVVNPPSADFMAMRDCPPSRMVHFYNQSYQPTSCLWDFGDGTTSTLQDPPPHTYASIGTYQVKLKTHNSIYGCSDSVVKAIKIYTTSTIVYAARPNICLDDTVTIVGEINGPPGARIAWKFDNNPYTPYADSNDILYQYTTKGPHSVTFVAISGDSSNCYDTLVMNNLIHVYKPVVNFTATPLLSCAPSTVTFTDASTLLSGSSVAVREWDFGDGVSVFNSGTITTHTYGNPGLDTVKLFIVDNFGCWDSLQRNGYIETRHPQAKFGVPNIICAHDSVQFSDSSKGFSPLTYQWSFGDGGTSTTRNPKHVYTNAGVYTSRLIVKDPTPCFDTLVRIDSVYTPTAGFTMDKNVGFCPPLVVNFTNTSTGAVAYAWNMGKGGSPLTMPDPQGISFPNPGKFDIILTAIDAHGCKDTAQDHVYMLGYNGAFAYVPPDGCVPQMVQFGAVVNNIPQITWDFGDGIVTTIPNSSTTAHTYTAAGTYHPKVIYSNGQGCNAPDSGLIPIRVDKVMADFSTSTPCVGVPFNLTNTSTSIYNTPDRWLWILSPPAADSVAGASTVYSSNTSGPHPVKLIARNSWGCMDSIIKNVFINPLPIIDAGPADTGICPGDTIRLIGHGGASYVWSPVALVSCTACDSTYVSSAAPTTYYLTGTDSNGCINKDSITARIQLKTTDSVLPGGEICIGESFRLSATGATIYHWQPEAFLDSPYIGSPLATPIITTHYVVEAHEGTCLVRYDTVTVVVHPAPYFDAGHDQIINYGGSVVLDPTRAGISRIEWKPDTTLSCWDCFDPTAHPPFTTIYYAKGYSEFGCEATDSVLVRVRCNGDSVYIPNTFTPNGDGLNDYFYPRGKGVDHMNSFRIYDRWGEMVFERQNFALNDEKSGWDGTFKGRQLSPDVYMYTMSSRCESGELVEWKGDVTLMR